MKTRITELFGIEHPIIHTEIHSLSLHDTPPAAS